MIAQSKYVSNLLSLLPPENMTRKYITAEMELAKCLSSNMYYVKYPISASILNIMEIKYLIYQLHG